MAQFVFKISGKAAKDQTWEVTGRGEVRPSEFNEKAICILQSTPAIFVKGRKGVTIQEKLVAAIKSHGFREIKYPTRRYVVLRRDVDRANLIFVGKAGALRAGSTVERSIPIETTKRNLLATGKF